MPAEFVSTSLKLVLVTSWTVGGGGAGVAAGAADAVAAPSAPGAGAVSVPGCHAGEATCFESPLVGDVRSVPAGHSAKGVTLEKDLLRLGARTFPVIAARRERAPLGGGRRHSKPGGGPDGRKEGHA